VYGSGHDLLPGARPALRFRPPENSQERKSGCRRVPDNRRDSLGKTVTDPYLPLTDDRLHEVRSKWHDGYDKYYPTERRTG
jgi:hypothetical protein